MTLTFWDVKERLKRLDEVTLLEVLDISSEEIVERFEDLIEKHYAKLEEIAEDL